MIIRRQWAGRARVLQVLNLIGPEGPIAPGKEPRGGTPGRNPQEGTQGRNLRQETPGRAGSIRPTGSTAPQAPQHHRLHSTTGPTAPQAPQHHRLHSTTGSTAPQAPQHHQYTVCSQHQYLHITHHIAHHPSIFILSTVSTKEKQ